MLRLAVLAALALAAAPQPEMAGDLRIHDPSVIEAGGRFVAFGTGEPGLTRGAIRLKTSPDGVHWSDAGAIRRGVPKWGIGVLGYQPSIIWAPSISQSGGVAFLYYALSSFGANASAIGLMTNSAFDPAHPAEGWSDQGVVIASTPKDEFNAIDPFRIDLADGRAFLAYGSFWSGIKLHELDPRGGKLKTDAPTVALADRHGAGIEAASVIEHAGRFYLFVSFDQCCKGIASTYNMRVGRADRLEGPYRDKDGKAMLEGGGSVLLATQGRFIGPGGQEAIHASHGDRVVYHYYDGDAAGASKLQLSPLTWSDDGWPELGPYPP